MRIDKLLFVRGLAPSRTRASIMIEERAVRIGSRTVRKPSEDVPEDSDIVIEETKSLCYVGRGALKLKAALEYFDIDPVDCIAVDIGASTGGFTQCLLDCGAKKVFAVDSGHNQLSSVLRGDPRVISIEGFNARALTADTIGGTCGIAVMDVSFISQRLLYSAVDSVLDENGDFVSLIKPQFEVGRDSIGKGGIVHDRESHVRAILSLFSESGSCGLFPVGLRKSPIRGGSGNIEYLAHFQRNAGGKMPDDGFVRGVVYEI